MTNAEFKALKARLQEKKDKANDLDKVMNAFGALTDAIKAFLPDEIKTLLKKYGYTE